MVVSLSLGSSAVMHFRPLIKQKKSTKPKVKTVNRCCLTLNLSHGDIVIQSGKAIQTRWQHSVKAAGIRIGKFDIQLGIWFNDLGPPFFNQLNNPISITTDPNLGVTARHLTPTQA